MTAIATKPSQNEQANLITPVRMRGKVIRFNDTKGYGFIGHAHGDVFFHYRDIIADGRRTAHIGQVADYTLHISSDGRLRASDVRLGAFNPNRR